MSNQLLVEWFGGTTQAICADENNLKTSKCLKNYLIDLNKLEDNESLTLRCCCKILKDDCLISEFPSNIIHATLNLKGGKGGFGALLKKQVPKKKYIQNYEACRTLTGKRYGDEMTEKEIQDWKRKKFEEKQLVDNELKTFQLHKEELEAQIKSNASRLDPKYKSQLVQSEKSIVSSVKSGMKKIKEKEVAKQMKKINLKII